MKSAFVKHVRHVRRVRHVRHVRPPNLGLGGIGKVRVGVGKEGVVLLVQGQILQHRCTDMVMGRCDQHTDNVGSTTDQTCYNTMEETMIKYYSACIHKSRPFWFTNVRCHGGQFTTRPICRANWQLVRTCLLYGDIYRLSISTQNDHGREVRAQRTLSLEWSNLKWTLLENSR